MLNIRMICQFSRFFFWRKTISGVFTLFHNRMRCSLSCRTAAIDTSAPKSMTLSIKCESNPIRPFIFSAHLCVINVIWIQMILPTVLLMNFLLLSNSCAVQRTLFPLFIFRLQTMTGSDRSGSRKGVARHRLTLRRREPTEAPAPQHW